MTVTETSSTSDIESNQIESNESSSCQVESTESSQSISESSVSQIESRESGETTSQPTVSQVESPESSNESPISQASINVESSKSSPSQELFTDPITVESNDNEPESEFMDTIVHKQEFFFSCIQSEDEPSDELLSLLDEFEPPDAPPIPPDDNILRIVTDTFASSVVLDSPDGNLALEMTMDDVIYYECFSMYDEPT